MSNSFAIPWTVAHQVPLSMGFSRQEYWSGSPFPSPGDLPDPGTKPTFPALVDIRLPLGHGRPHGAWLGGSNAWRDGCSIFCLLTWQATFIIHITLRILPRLTLVPLYWRLRPVPDFTYGCSFGVYDTSGWLMKLMHYVNIGSHVLFFLSLWKHSAVITTP